MQLLTECNKAVMAAELLAGKTFILPTETSYGLCCDATNAEAVEAIFKIKGRPKDKPLLVVVPDSAAAKKIMKWNPLLEKLAKEHWPGALTVVGEYAHSEPSLVPGVVGADGTVAVRVTSHSLLSSLSGIIGRPLVATSGNISASGDVYSSAAVVAQFNNHESKPDYVYDGGQLPVQPPTTIVSVIGGVIKVIRQGKVKVA